MVHKIAKHVSISQVTRLLSTSERTRAYLDGEKWDNKLLRARLFAPLRHTYHLWVSERNRPMLNRRRLSLTHAVLEKLNCGGVDRWANILNKYIKSEGILQPLHAPFIFRTLCDIGA